MNEKSEGVQTVERALSVLTTFTPEHDVWGITALSQELGLPKSVVHRILTSLQRFGFVEQEAHSEKYRLGLRIVELGRVAAGHFDLRQSALPVMQALARDTGESTLLTVQDGHFGVCIEFVEGSQSMTLKTSFGTRLPLHCGASKKILLAYLPEEFVEHYLEVEPLVQLSDHSKVDPEALRRELAEIRATGVSVTANEIDVGATLIAAPILGHDGAVVAGFGLGGPSFRFPEDKIREFQRLVREGARNISLRLGYKG
ncbi:MAG: IclR family transcriptional regulator [Desulfitobacteriaceae bacterium]|nr:IclR family transcriptional regulator [Desulfitobacteriaceae bacterium]MDI6916103.1 IclR family transcriptional regulator [Desulfitobacteriaceae bacterium]